jgi:phage terminase large subunit-like protein
MNKLVRDIEDPFILEIENKIKNETEKKEYIFDLNKANRPIEWIEKFCVQTKGANAGKPVKLELFQKAIIQALFGFVEKKDKTRLYTKLVLFLGRKNGKSTLASLILLYVMIGEKGYRKKCFSVATTAAQARESWETAKVISEISPVLNKVIRTNNDGIFYDKKKSEFKPLPNASNRLDGKDSSVILADEVHAWLDMNMMDVMYDSMASEIEPLFIEVSTMGTIRESVFDQEYENLSKVIKTYDRPGKIKSPRTLMFIYELDDYKDIEDQECWLKANPGLGTIKKYDFLYNKIEEAKNDPNKLPNIYCKDFNMRMTSNKSWLSFEMTYNTEKIDLEKLKYSYAIGGVDLSSTTDLTCATLLIYKEGKKYVLQQYFLPEIGIERRIKEDEIPYDKWVERGWLTLSENNASVRYSDVTEWFIKMRQELKLGMLYIGFDPWGATYWKEEMEKNGFTLEKVIQGAKTMSGPMKILEADFKTKSVIYDNNQILRWCLTNTEIQVDVNENIRPIKGRNRRKRIDGTVSLINAYVVLMNHLEDYKNLMKIE